MPNGKTAERLEQQKRELDELISEAARLRDQATEHIKTLQRAGTKAPPNPSTTKS